MKRFNNDMNIDYQFDNAIDNTVWELHERELLDNVDPKNTQYSSWWHNCDLIEVFDFGVCSSINFHTSRTN